MRKIFYLIVCFLLISSPSWADTYYVATTGTNAWPGCSQGSPCLTIDYVADRVSAGDTVRVQVGTYNETVSPGVNGSSSSVLVTFVADGDVNVRAWTFTNSSYIKVVGFHIDGTCGGSTTAYLVTFSGTNTGLEFWHNTLENMDNDGFRSGNIYNSIIIGNTIGPMRAARGTGNYGNAIQVSGNNNLIAYNTVPSFDYIGFALTGTYNRLLNNNVSGLEQISGRHPDMMYFSHFQGNNHNLIEAGLNIGTITAADNKWFHMETADSTNYDYNIFRKNVVHDLGSGAYSAWQVSGTLGRIFSYNNTLVELLRYYNTSVSSGTFSGTATVYIYNDLLWEAWGENTTTGIVGWVAQSGASLTADYSLGYDPDGSVTFTSPWTGQGNAQTNQDPLLTNVGGNVFTLSSTSSKAYQTGGPLTTTSGAGTGTTFNAATNGGGFFVGSDATNLPQYSGALVPGDTITVGTDVVTVVSISGDAITVTPSFTWANGDSVYFGNNTTPDIGAYPYKAGGYTLTGTYTNSGGTVTVTPSDAGLVRFVVCYENGIPTTVDNSSPYTCSVGSGTVSVKLYSLYASTTPVITATTTLAPNQYGIGFTAQGGVIR